MSVSIHIKKRNNAPSVLTVKRPDGTTTFSKLQVNFEIHDIAHYAVEKKLQLKNAFYGLLSQGYQINDFLLPKEERPEALQPQNIPQEALATEHLVNLLTIDFMSTESQMDILKTLESTLIENELSFPEQVDNEKIILIQQELANLMAQWDELNGGQELKLELEL